MQTQLRSPRAGQLAVRPLRRATGDRPKTLVFVTVSGLSIVWMNHAGRDERGP